MKMKFYKTQNVCAKNIGVVVENRILKEVDLTGCCDGDRQVLEVLLKNMEITDIIKKFRYVECGNRGTSCIQELCKILENFL